MKWNRSRLQLEPLETRYAPATLVNPFTVTYRDDLGERVVVKISKPVFEEATINSVFDFDNGGVNGDNGLNQLLKTINLTGLQAAGATLTITDLDDPDGTFLGQVLANDLDLAAVIVHGNLGAVSVGDSDLSTPGLGLLQCRNLTGEFGPSTVQGDLTKVKIGVRLLGFLDVNGSIGSFKAEGLLGGGDDDSGHLRCAGDISTVLLTEFMDGDGGGQRTGLIEAGGDIGKVTIRGNVTGDGEDCGRITAGGNLGKVVITGDLRAVAGSRAGSIFAFGDIGSVKIGGDLSGGTAVDTGAIFTQTGRIGSVSIGGSLQAGTGVRSGSIRAATDLGSLKVAGNVTGNAVRDVIISGFGQAIHGPTTDLAIGKVKVGGSVNGALILAGFNTLGNVGNEDAQIGSVTIGDSFFVSSIVAGIDDGADNLFGTADDELFDEAAGDPNIVAKIGTIIIHGDLNGSSSGTDGFGFVAEEIGKLSIEGAGQSLTAGPGNDQIVLGNEGDFNLKEV